jgi:hypothetical protein
MTEIQMRSDLARSRQPHISEGRFLARLVLMGIVKQPATTEAAMEALLRQGICTQAAREWLEDCPSPGTEWQVVREVLDDDTLLAGLLGIGAISVRRYARGERQCSDVVAARLHWLALLIDQLEGTYNAYGIRRWFQRPRSALNGQSPQARLNCDWDPDDATVQPIMALARSASLGLVAS